MNAWELVDRRSAAFAVGLEDSRPPERGRWLCGETPMENAHLNRHPRPQPLRCCVQQATLTLGDKEAASQKVRRLRVASGHGADRGQPLYLDAQRS